MSCEAYYTEADLVDGNCPIHGRPVELVTEENYFFRLSALRAAAARLVRAAPRLRATRSQAQRGPRASSARACRTSRSAARRSAGASRCRGTPRHVTYVWFDALTNYITAVGYGSDEERFEHVVAGPPRHRQGHPPVPLRLLAGDAAVGRPRPARAGRRARVPPRRRREDVQDEPQPDRARPTSWPTSASTGSATTSWPTCSFGADGDFSYEGMVARYNADLANNLGNLLARVATVVDKKCGGIGPAPRPDSPLAEAAADDLRRGCRGVGRVPAQRGPGRHVAAGARHQRPPGGQRALEGRARARPSTPCSATPSRRCGSSRSWPRRPSPRRPRPSGSASA